MAPKPQFDPQYLDEHHQRISEFASDYVEDDEERAAFMDWIMEKRGYQRTSGWGLPPPPAPAGGNGAPPAGPRPGPFFKQR